MGKTLLCEGLLKESKPGRAGGAALGGKGGGGEGMTQ